MAIPTMTIRYRREVREHMTTIFGVDADTLPCASDGCSVPTYALPLDVMALGFAKLGAGYFSDAINQAATRLRTAQANAPFMVAGSERLDTMLLEVGHWDDSRSKWVLRVCILEPLLTERSVLL